ELAQGDLGVVRGFFLQLDVAQLDGTGRRMRAVGVQLFGSRQTLRTRQREAQRMLRRERPDRTSGNRGTAVIGVAPAIGLDVLPFVSQAELVTPGAGRVFLEQEQAVVAGQRRRNVGLLAERFEITPQGLPTQYAAPAEQRPMGQLQAGVGGIVVETGTDFATLDFLVLVVGVPDAQPRQLEARQRFTQLAAQVPAFLPHVAVGYAAVLMIVVVMTVSMATAVPVAAMGMAIGMLVGQQTVAIVLLAVSQAEIAARTDVARAQCEAVGVVVGTGLPGWRAGNLVFIGLALGAFGAHG